MFPSGLFHSLFLFLIPSVCISVEKLHNVKYFYNSELDLLYLSSSDKKKLVFHVPIPTQFSLSPAWLHNVNTVLLKENSEAE